MRLFWYLYKRVETKNIIIGMLEETSFIIPEVSHINFKILKFDRSRLVSNLGFSKELLDIRNNIADVPYSAWLSIRKTVNSLEHPLDSTKIKKPVSRSFFKLLELVKDHGIPLDGNTLHLAESPGGFIEATEYLKKKKRINNDTYYTFSLIGPKAPIYNKNLIKNPDITVLSNYKNKGDLYEPVNIKYLAHKLQNENIQFITCDGGIDEMDNFNMKEQLHHRLIYNELLTSIMILKRGGSMILKIFDIFTELTFDYIYLLSYLFGEVSVCKPNTSRPTNSEKYIVCKFFKKHLLTHELLSKLQSICFNNVESISSFVDKTHIEKEFVDCIRKHNDFFSKYQAYHINNIIQIYKLKLNVFKKEECIKNWVLKYY